MSAWPELVAVAVLGTQRRDPPVLGDHALAGIVADDGAEDRLLSAAGSLAVLRRAGQQARAAPPLPGPAPADARPAGGSAAAHRLVVLLDDHHALLPEWLRAVAQRGLRVPAERLPELLEAATTHQALRGPVEAVLGERGHWLAAQAPRWGWAAPLPGTDDEREALWLTGARAERHRLFAGIRRSEPATARHLLERALPREEGADRAWFVAALGEGLSPADEPLLESALDDRRQEVRAAAARLLSRLPGSAFARRMTERTVPLVRVTGGTSRRLRIALPDEPGASAARDGIVCRPPRGIGERAWWLLQLVASTPLSAWDAVGLSPELAAALPVPDDLGAPLRRGFAQAAAAQCDRRWAAALLGVDPRLAEVADPRQAAAAALDGLRVGETDIAERLPAPWPRELSEGALDLLVRLLSRPPGPAASSWLHRLIAERLDPALAGEAARHLDRVEPGTTHASLARDLARTLSFRQDMYEELRR